MSTLSCICSRLEAIDITGVPIHTLSPAEALVRIEQFLACPETHVVNHLPVDPIVQARGENGLGAALSRAALNVPDGMGVVWGARALGATHLRQRVYGPDFLLAVAEWGLSRGVRHAFVGGSPQSLVRMIEGLQGRFPGLEVSGSHAPPMRSVTRSGVEEDLAVLGAEADVLWVGLGTPKQQLWADLARAHRPAKVIATVGAAFDFLAGDKRQAPAWMQDRGLEWAFRLASEPRRLWRRYLIGNPRFAWAVAKQRIRP